MNSQFFSFSLSAILFSVLFSTSSLFATDVSGETSRVAPQTTQDIYIDTLEAQHQLMKSVGEREQIKLAQIQNLHRHGDSTWLAFRTQELRHAAMKAREQSFCDFVQRVKQAKEEGKIRSEFILEQLRGQISFTDLQVEFDDASANRNQRALRSLISQTKKLLRLKREEIAAKSSSQDLKGGASTQTEVMQCQQQLLETRLALLEAISASANADAAPQAEVAKPARGIPSKQILGLFAKQCRAHRKLTAHTLDHETSRLKDLNELASKKMATAGEVETVKARIAQLGQLKSDQEQVLSYLESQIKVADDKSTKASNEAGFDLKTEYVIHEATSHLATAKLESKMLSEVVQRLEEALVKLSRTQGGTFVEMHRNEIAHYRWKIQTTKLQQELAEARLNAAQIQQQTQLAIIFATSQDKRLSDSTRPQLLPTKFAQVKFSKADFTLASSRDVRKAPLSRRDPIFQMPSMYRSFGAINELPTALVSLPSSLVQTSPLGLPPLFFRDLDPNYRPVQLRSNRRSLGLSLNNRKSSFYASSSVRGSSDIIRHYDYGSVYSPTRRPLPMFFQPYQSGVLRPEYRHLITPGQSPWLIPGFRNRIFIQP